jgi:hypothetical protein
MVRLSSCTTQMCIKKKRKRPVWTHNDLAYNEVCQFNEYQTTKRSFAVMDKGNTTKTVHPSADTAAMPMPETETSAKSSTTNAAPGKTTPTTKHARPVVIEDAHGGCPYRICGSLPFVYHTLTIQTLKASLVAPSSQIVLLQGAHGCGKTYAIQEACRQVNLHARVIDTMSGDDTDYFKQLLLNSCSQGMNPNNTTSLRQNVVAVLDCVEGFSSTFLRTFGDFLTKVTRAGGTMPSVASRRARNNNNDDNDNDDDDDPRLKRFRFRVNPLIITCGSDVPPQVFQFLQRFQTVVVRLTCEPLTMRQSANLARHVCAQWQVPQTHVGDLCRQHAPDMNAILAHLRMAGHGTRGSLSPAAKDPTTPGFFTLCKALLQPTSTIRDEDAPTDTTHNEKDNAHAHAYHALWEAAGPNVEECFYRSYLLTLASVPSTTVSAAMDSMASSLSLMDCARTGRQAHNPAFVYFAHGMCRRTLLRSNCSSSVPPQLILVARTGTLTGVHRAALGMCRMDYRKREVFSYALLMHRWHYQQQLRIDATHCIPWAYELRANVSSYETLNHQNIPITLDLCDTHQGKTYYANDSHRTKAEQTKFILAHPATQVQALLSTAFSFARSSP